VSPVYSLTGACLACAWRAEPSADAAVEII
jgi:hypothetical protein